MLTVAGVAIVFAFLWRKGHFLRLTTYIRETREELRKCTWPSWAELKGSTVVVMISIALLGAFTVGIDMVIAFLVRATTPFSHAKPMVRHPYPVRPGTEGQREYRKTSQDRGNGRIRQGSPGPHGTSRRSAQRQKDRHHAQAPSRLRLHRLAPAR